MITASLSRTAAAARVAATTRPVVVVFLAYALFTATLGVATPVLISQFYGVQLQPEDFYQMPIRGGDYIATYAAANRVLRGHPIYDATPFEPSETDPYARLYSYPPLHVYAFVPLAGLPFVQSYQVWVAITIALLLASCLLAASLTEAPLLAFVALALIYAQSSFLQFQIERGQTDAPTAFLLAAMVYFYVGKRRNIYLVALCLAVAALFKALPAAFFLFFILRREFKIVGLACLTAAALILLTSPPDWITWVRFIAPTYSTYFLGYNVDHSLYYLFEGITHDLPSALTLARVTGGILLATYSLLVLLNKRRNQLVLLELAIFTTIIEIVTPWSANYKLVILLFLFLVPFSLLEIERVRAKPLRYILPIFALFALVIPTYGEYVTRLPYSLLVQVLPTTFLASNPLNPYTTDRKVVVGLVACVVYLLVLYATTIEPGQFIRPLSRVTSWVRDAPSKLRLGRLPPRVVAGVLVALALVALVTAYRRTQAVDQSLVAQFGREVRVNDAVSVAGYNVHYDSPTHYTITIVYHVHKPIPGNWQIYLHANTLDDSGKITSTIGRNFFPSIITSFWPTDTYVEATTDSFFSPQVYTLNVGFFDLSNGAQFGEASLGPVDFPAPSAAS